MRRSFAAAAILAALSLLLTSTAGAWQMLDDEAVGAFSLGGELVVTDPAAVDLQLLFGAANKDKPASYYLASVKGRQASFSLVTAGKTTPIGISGEIPLPTKDQTVEIALHRDDWRMALIWDGKVVAKAYHTGPAGAAIGYEGRAGVKVEDVWLQLLGDIAAGDTFERTEEEDQEKSEWEALSGKWTLISLREDTQAGQMHADKTTNAFSYHATAAGSGLSKMGSWFWRNYEMTAAVRARGNDGALGLAFYVKDENNYLLLRWDNRFTAQAGGPHVRLIGVADGKQQVLTERPGGYLPDQWYNLTVNLCDDHIFCFIDDQPVLEAATNLFGQGPVGLYVEGEQGAWFDDVKVTNWANMVENFEQDQPLKWVAASGQWLVTDGAARPQTADSSLLVTGSAKWNNYAFSARLSGNGGAHGLATCYKSPTDAYVFRWAPNGAPVSCAGKAQIVRLSADGEKVLAEKPLPSEVMADTVATVLSDEEYLAGLLDGKVVVDTIVEAPPSGAIGVFSEGSKDVAFKDVRVEPLPERRMARVVKEFTDSKTHFEMVEWASTRHNWIVPVEGEPQNIFWTKGDYHGPLRVQFDLKQVGSASGTMHVTIEGDRADAKKGYRLDITATKGSKALALTLSSDGEKIAEAKVEAKGATCPICVERRGAYVFVTVDSQAVIKVSSNG